MIAVLSKTRNQYLSFEFCQVYEHSWHQSSAFLLQWLTGSLIPCLQPTSFPLYFVILQNWIFYSRLWSSKQFITCLNALQSVYISQYRMNMFNRHLFSAFCQNILLIFRANLNNKDRKINITWSSIFFNEIFWLLPDNVQPYLNAVVRDI
jgi:hypothetical protein